MAKPRLRFMKVVKAAGARALFILHSLLAISRVCAVYKDSIYWCLGSLLLLLVAEGFMNIYFRGGDETVGFCPCVFLYLCSVVPAVWLLELDLAQAKPVKRSPDFNDYNAELDSLLDSFNVDSGSQSGSSGLFVQAVEQLLLVVLVIGRWMLPKGELSREELSQLLLVYVGTAADITELFETFKEKKVHGNLHIRYLILSLWSWSLLQFTIVLSSGGGRARRRVGRTRRQRKHKTLEKYMDWWKWFTTNMDVWGIMISTCLQDGPFLSIRLYLMLGVEVLSYMMIFFTCKNSLVLMLQLYRFVVLVCDRRRQRRSRNRVVELHPSTTYNALHPLTLTSSSSVIEA